MNANDALISRPLTAIDDRDWPLLAGLVTADIRYDRPGYPTISGVRELLYFYRNTPDHRRRQASARTIAHRRGARILLGYIRGSFEIGGAIERNVRRLVRVHR